MAYEKKSENSAYRRLKNDLAAGHAGNLYVFYGEEDYLKSYYVGRLRALCGGLFDSFSIVTLDGDRLTADALSDAVDSPPLGGEHKLVLVRDYKLLQPVGVLRELLPELLSNLPEYISLVFLFKAMEFKPDKRLSLYKLLEKHGELVEFQRAPDTELIPWVKRRFFALHKSIDTPECEYLLFLCGASMTNLVTETDKIAAGTKGEKIARADIDRLASRVLDANVFEMTDKLMAGDCCDALRLLRDLLDLRQEPIMILGALAAQFRRLYGARLALEAHKDEQYVAEMFSFRSSYPARLLLQAARKRELPALRQLQEFCLRADLELKSNNSDPGRTLELLLLRSAEAGI